MSNRWYDVTEETPPQDSTRVEVFRKDYAESRAIAWWSKGCECWITTCGNELHGVTHWRFLSANPYGILI